MGDTAKRITKITRQKRRGRFNIFLNEEYSFSVTENTLINFRLTLGEVISDSLLQNIKSDDELNYAYQKAVNYLSHYLRSKFEVKNKLVELDVSSKVIEEVIVKLINNNLIDDQEYATSYVNTSIRSGNKGPAVIRQYLKSKKIEETIINKAIETFDEQQQFKVVENLANKLQNRSDNTSFINKKNKIKKTLLSKGFSYTVVNDVLDNFDIQIDEEEELANIKKIGLKYLDKNKTLDLKQRKFKTKQFLYRKGFSLDSINQFMDTLD